MSDTQAQREAGIGVMGSVHVSNHNKCTLIRFIDG